MQKINLGKGGEITLTTTLTKGQVSKFNSLFNQVIVDQENVAYFPLDLLHGVLLTNSKARAKEIVNNYDYLISRFVTYDPVRFAKFGVDSAIRPMGLYTLLEQLAADNPKKADNYRASLALVAYVVAVNHQLTLAGKNHAIELDAKLKKIVDKLKRDNNVCQISGESFLGTEEKHAHHILAASECPSEMTESSNIIIVKKWIHDDYHHWASTQKLPINDISLRYYAKFKGFLGLIA